MIFRQWHDVLYGKKTQTRRLMKSSEWADVDKKIAVSSNGRLKWEVGRIYAVQSKRGRGADGHIKLLRIRNERLQDISAEDCVAEGLSTNLREQDAVEDLRDKFIELWNSIHQRPGDTFYDNPLVWVLEFRPTGAH